MSIHELKSVLPVVVLYLPFEHLKHEALPIELLYVLAAHGGQNDAPPLKPLDVPFGQREQEVDPVVSLYFPVPQVVQALTPAPLPNDPVEQSLQVSTLCAPTLALKVPAEHTAHEVAAIVSPYVPIGQLTHVLSEAGLYVPAIHAVHAAPFDVPEYPVRQVQSSMVSLPGGESVPVGHVKHISAPVMLLYVPAVHGTHIPAPVADL